MVKKQVIFFHGGGAREDYDADRLLMESLKGHLGPDYDFNYPFLPNDGTPDLGRRVQIGKEISDRGGNVLLVAHSFGASMLLARLSEFETEKNIAGIFLIATPFWQGDEDWVEPFKLQPDFAEKLDKAVPLFFYHCRDDEEVPLEQFETYRQYLPWAIFREVKSGGHQFGNDLFVVAEDIRAL